MKIITENATISTDGYNAESGVSVVDHGDSISIGRSEHRKEDLIIDMQNHRITSKIADWDLSW